MSGQTANGGSATVKRRFRKRPEVKRRLAHLRILACLSCSFRGTNGFLIVLSLQLFLLHWIYLYYVEVDRLGGLFHLSHNLHLLAHAAQTLLLPLLLLLLLMSDHCAVGRVLGRDQLKASIRAHCRLEPGLGLVIHIFRPWLMRVLCAFTFTTVIPQQAITANLILLSLHSDHRMREWSVTVTS